MGFDVCSSCSRSWVYTAADGVTVSRYADRRQLDAGVSLLLCRRGSMQVWSSGHLETRCTHADVSRAAIVQTWKHQGV